MPDFKKEKVSIAKNAFMKRMYQIKKTGKTPPRYIVLYSGILLFALLTISALIVGVYYLHDLPSITEIENDILPESSIIYDRNGNELYNLYSKEKRTYVPYNSISKHVLDAVTSTEDKTFFENQGIDLRWLVRSAYNYLSGKTDKIQGTSTISQQLIKNIFLSNERSISRKVKEIYLSYQLNAKYSKEKILELYLNKISFGNNAYGIEEASKTYFNKSSKDVGVLGSAILASLPKGPTYYSPYSHRDRLMGYFYAYLPESPKDTIMIDTSEKMKDFKPLVDGFKQLIDKIQIRPLTSNTAELCSFPEKMLKKKLSVDSRGCSVVDYSDLQGFLNNIRITSKESIRMTNWFGAVKAGTGVSTESNVSSDYILEYNTGRKDFVLGRMFEDQKITGDDYKNALMAGFDFQFQKYSDDIKYPHFVFYVKDYLENKYGKDFESQGGLRIYTTIDPILQDKAEELVTKQVKINTTKYGAKSAALVSIDNKTGQIIAMVGWADYFNDQEDGNVNVITSKRQPGSSFKPIVYSLAISKNPIGPDTPIFDVKTKFGSWEPNDYDEKFLGKMSVKKALDYSRNIPAVKMLYVAGGEASVVAFAQSLGIASLSADADYGAPLAIGTWELKPIELLQAYSVFANGGYLKDLTPILKIEDKKGNVIEQYADNAGKYVFSDAASYIISTILSDASSRPNDFWNNVLTLKDRPIAAKTGTSNKEVNKKGEKKKILPRDLWTAWYTPQITTVVWAGNVDGSETKGTCDGLNCAAPIWHDFMEAAHKKLPKEEFKKPDSVYSATISQISGKLASETTPTNMRVTSIFAVKPTEYEGGFKEIEVDSLCNGTVTSNTPKDAIKKVYYASNISPIIDSYVKDWLNPIYGWTKSDSGKIFFSGSVITEHKDEVCVRPNANLANISVSSSFKNGGKYPIGKYPIEIQYSSDNPIVKLEMLKDGILLQSIPINERSVGTYNTDLIDFGDSFVGDHTLVFRAIDRYGYAGTSSVSVTFETGQVGLPIDPVITDTEWGPLINLVNPLKEAGMKIYEDQYFNLRFSVAQKSSEVTAVNIYVDSTLSKIFGSGKDFIVAVNEEKHLSVWVHSIIIEAIDAQLHKTKQAVSFEVIPR